MPTPLRVVHVEDDPFDTEMIQATLQREGLLCDFMRVENGEELLAAIRTRKFDIILSDYSLPTFDGFAALALRQQHCPELPFILISGTLGEEAAIEAFERGATDYVLKHRLERLGPGIRRALREAQERSERQKAEAELKLAHQRLRFHLENSPLAVIEWDAGFRALYWSPQAERLFGWSANEALGRTPWELQLVPESDGVLVQERIGPLLSGQQLRSTGENRNQTRTGKIIWCDWYNSAVSDDNDRLISILSLGLDITARKQIEQELNHLLTREQEAREIAEAANRARDEFLATVSHELRTPLTPVLGWLHLIRSRTLDKATVDNALEKIERNVRLQMRLIEDLLEVSRVITGKLQLVYAPLDLCRIITAAVETMRQAAQAKGIELQQHSTAEPCLVSGDQDRLQQVIWNLISNAIKFTPSGGRVDVQLTRRTNELEVSVSDTGRGISADFLPHVFDRFRQEDSSITRAHSGLGLGLSIVRHLVELHGGTVNATSPGINAGATFSFTLPLLPGLPEHPAQKTTDTAHQNLPLSMTNRQLEGLNFLLVDDDAETLEILSWLLKAQGGEVHVATSVKEAVELYQSVSCDLIISDIGMPDQNGFDLISAIRAARLPAQRPVPAIALSAFTRNEDREQAEKAGFQTHISKPVEPAELLAVIVSLTRKNQEPSP